MKSIAGDEFLDWADEAVVGLWDVLKKYGYFKEQFDRMLVALTGSNPPLDPDRLPRIQSPSCKAAKERLPKTKIIYYVSPQVWHGIAANSEDGKVP
jgi:lipid-A-disaccharide synthase